MTFNEFKAWLEGYAEALGPDATDVARILKEAEKVQAEPPSIWNNGRLIGDTAWLYPTNKDTLGGDCGCLPGTTCGNSACPRAPKVSC